MFYLLWAEDKMKIIFRSFANHFGEWSRASDPSSQHVILSRSLLEYLHHVCFLSVNPNESNLILSNRCRRLEAKNSQGTKETWVIRVEKCHFGSCCRPHWSVRAVIKSDSCTIDNAPVAHLRAELPSTHSPPAHMQEGFLLAWLVSTLTPPNIKRRLSKNSQKASMKF